ncbi:MAG TPA: T9SS type A sorting domain-containing protein, partial [Chitinophagaceae bacterium]|nr:T9SS type A sorting domain-containing protein [Chitinophagaceae bacterium]
ASAYNITFKEDIKPSGNSIISAPIRIKQLLQANLFINNNGAISLMDGIKADIGGGFSNVLDDNDAYKISNSSENVSLKRNGKLLSVERHNTITANDTFYLDLSNMKTQNYQWQLNMENLDQPGLRGFLQDNFTNANTSLNLNGINVVDFNVNNVPGSYAAGRFIVVFTQAKVLSVTFTNVIAYLQNKNIKVEWKVENETGIKQYEVERSADGNSYTRVNTTAAKNTPVSLYIWVDANAQSGYNYYRIKSIDINGKIEYSKVVKVLIETGKGSPSILVYPNPVTGKIISMQLNNIKTGNYSLQLFNEAGQLISIETIRHNAAVSSESIEINKRFAAGKYDMELSGEGLKLTTPLIKK